MSMQTSPYRVLVMYFSVLKAGVHCPLQVLQLMELTALRNAHVGTPGVSGLSVEQRKRLTIGVELVANPSIIFMDVS